MREMLSIRFAGAAGIISIALFSAALISFPSFPTTGANLPAAARQNFVNRTLKGDRLSTSNRADGPGQVESPVRSQPRQHIPLGCDAAFSPISSPSLGHVFRRCMA